MRPEDVLARPAARNGLTPWDDYPVHQRVDVLENIEPPLPGWSERFYFNVQRPTGELVAIVGGGVYPARGVSECYLCTVDGDRQTNLRATQATDGSGPFSFAIEEPMRRWHLQVDVEGERLLDARYTATREPYLYRVVDIPAAEPGGGFDRFRHFVGSGEIEVEPPSMPGRHLSARDRTWGVRTRRSRLHSWCVLHLDGCTLNLIHQELADGSVHFSEAALCHDDGTDESLRVAGHEIEFDPQDRQVATGSLRLEGAYRHLTLEFERVGQAIRLAGAGYDDRQGDRGDAGGVQRDEYDLADPSVAQSTGRGTMDAGVRARLTSGAWSAEGVGVVETAVARDHVTYGGRLASSAR